MSADQVSEHYIKLLDFICKCDELEDIRELYEALDVFCQSDFLTSPLLVYSLNKDKEVGEKRKCRGLWNKGKESLYYTKEEVDYFNGKIAHDEELGSRWKEYKLSNGHFYIIPSGESLKQTFFSVFKTDHQINKMILDYLQTFLGNTSVKLKKYNEANKLKSLIHIDDVTGLYNQRKFSLDLDNHIKRFNEQKEEFAIIFIDIDHFKQVNDGHGHLVGTSLLKQVAGIIKNTVREFDLCYRYGGDEFVVLIPDSKGVPSPKIGERILGNIKKKKFTVEEDESISAGGSFNLTVSIGIASFPNDANGKNEIIALADKMMYKAKEQGRGKVVFADNSKGE